MWQKRLKIKEREMWSRFRGHRQASDWPEKPEDIKEYIRLYDSRVSHNFGNQTFVRSVEGNMRLQTPYIFTLGRSIVGETTEIIGGGVGNITYPWQYEQFPVGLVGYPLSRFDPVGLNLETTGPHDIESMCLDAITRALFNRANGHVDTESWKSLLDFAEHLKGEGR